VTIPNRWNKAALALAAALSTMAARADLPVEQATVAPLAPATAQRLYLSDMVISHFVDGKLMIIDGESFKVQGHVALGMTGHATLSPDRSEILVSTAYMTKLNRGERIGELDVYDAATLKLKAEISVPNKHAQSMPYRGSVRTTADGRFVMLQNATPAQSITVVDRKAEKFVTEIQTPGCWMIYPAQSVPNRFATLCGDGTMLTITLDDNGMPVQRKKSRKFFDADADALFVAGDQDGDNYSFVSFHGKLQTVNVAGEEAQPAEAWSLVSAADAKAGWRPGGYQPMSLQLASGRLYVAMHPKGKEGSHKEPAKEIWVFDLASKQRVAKLPGEKATVITTTRGDAPKLYALTTETGVITAYDAGPKPKKLRQSTPFSEFGTQMDAQ
jgi:methylamine dehydrogenase heavy chain